MHSFVSVLETTKRRTMKIFVAGATGAVGKRLIPLLVSTGHDVVGTTTSAEKTSALREAGAEPVVVDLLDAQAVAEAVRRAEPEVIVHQGSALSGPVDLRHFDDTFAVTNRLRTQGTDNLLGAARAAGVRRLVAQSYTGWPNAREGGPVKAEEDPLDPNPPAAQRQSLAAIRHVEGIAREDGIEGLALRYGAFYGPGTSIVEGGEIVESIRKRKFPIVGGGAGVWSFVHMDDVAGATLAAIERGAPGVYNVVDDDPAAVSEWLPFLASAIGAKPPRRAPKWLGRLAAGEVAVVMMTESRGSSNAKAKRELGWQLRYPSWRQGFRELSTSDR
jgi:2-alkyl-3-oxoalkanoate reductase